MHLINTTMYFINSRLVHINHFRAGLVVGSAMTSEYTVLSVLFLSLSLRSFVGIFIAQPYEH